VLVEEKIPLTPLSLSLSLSKITFLWELSKSIQSCSDHSVILVCTSVLVPVVVYKFLSRVFWTHPLTEYFTLCLYAEPSMCNMFGDRQHQLAAVTLTIVTSQRSLQLSLNAPILSTSCHLVHGLQRPTRQMLHAQSAVRSGLSCHVTWTCRRCCITSPIPSSTSLTITSWVHDIPYVWGTILSFTLSPVNTVARELCRLVVPSPSLSGGNQPEMAEVKCR
jgi:hypothetical protein